MAPDDTLVVRDPGEGYHPPIAEMGPHAFVDSEFEHGKGRCDRCGGGPLAEIHAQKADPLERIAVTLEGKDFIVPAATLTLALERIAGELGRMASRNNHEIIAIWAAVAVISWLMGIVVGHAWK